MVRIKLGTALACGVVIALAYPVVRDITVRYTIEHRLLTEGNASDAAALQHWAGSTQSFVDMMRERCILANASDTTVCDHYRTSY